MGNSESLQKRNRQSSCSGSPTTSQYDKIHSANSWNDLDNKIASTPMLDEISEEDKLVLNKKKLKLRAEFADLEYAVRHFSIKPLNPNGGVEGDTISTSHLLTYGTSTSLVTTTESSQQHHSSVESSQAGNNRYEGTFKDGQLFGQGIYFYPSGSIYMGDIHHNSREGQGVFYFANGNIYSGAWRDNDQNGLGKFFFVQDGKLFQFYQGNFEKSLYSGFGCYCYQTKYYVGYWKDDKYEGHGQIFSFEGKLLKSGIFKADKFVSEISSEEIIFPNNWKSYLPNFSQELALFRSLAQNQPII